MAKDFVPSTPQATQNSGFDGIPPSETIDYGRRFRVSGKIIAGGVVLGLAIAAGVRSWSGQGSPFQAEVPGPRNPSMEELDVLRQKVERLERWETKVQPRLVVANEASRSEIDKNIQVLVAFVEGRKQGSREFAKAILSLKGKWRFVRSQLPTWLAGTPNGHAEYLQEQFDRNVFSSDDFRKTVENVVTGYMNSVSAIENELLVDIGADLADLQSVETESFASDETLRRDFERLSQELTARIARELKIDAAEELGKGLAAGVAAKFAVEIMASLATRLGVTSGLLAAGTVSSVATFGLSIVAAIVVEMTLDWLISLVYDPEGAVADKVNAFLDQVVASVINGFEIEQGHEKVPVPGLKEKLMELHRLRARIRADALRQLVVGGAATHAP